MENDDISNKNGPSPCQKLKLILKYQKHYFLTFLKVLSSLDMILMKKVEKDFWGACRWDVSNRSKFGLGICSYSQLKSKHSKKPYIFWKNLNFLMHKYNFKPWKGYFSCKFG